MASRSVTSDAELAEIDCKARWGRVSVSRVDRDAVSLARLGWRKLRAGETVSPERLEANYMRRSDAEIFAKESS